MTTTYKMFSWKQILISYILQVQNKLIENIMDVIKYEW